MASTLTNIQSYTSALPLFAPAVKNTFSDNHYSQKAAPTPSLNSNSVVSQFSQSKRHPSLPPRPPVVVSTSTADRIDGLPRCPNEVDRAFNNLVPATIEMKSCDVESPVCAIVKGILLLGPCAAVNRVDPQRGSHHQPVQGQATSLGFDALHDHSTPIPDDFDSYLSKKQSSGSITSNKPWPKNLMTLSVGDGIFDRKVAGRPPKRSRTELDGCYLEKSNHELAKSPSMAPGSEDLGPDNEDSESASDTENGQDLGDRWEYRRIVARRIDSSGRRMAQVEWKNTWEPEDELDGLKRALRRYAKERRGSQSPTRGLCPNCGAKKRKYDA
ncbi:hypothetical protein ZTR_09655 [Talaromyces verruculosus]|nr:hypothetical protein ZTR_09655 [Talaromyces verruculosus]